MRLLIDMNLSSTWAGYLSQLGHDAVHWSAVGEPDDGDEVILQRAEEQDRVILTCDLDFGAMLVANHMQRPSIVQLRTEVTMVARIGPLVADAIERAEAELHSGAIVTIEANRLRIRPLGTDRQ